MCPSYYHQGIDKLQGPIASEALNTLEIEFISHFGYCVQSSIFFFLWCWSTNLRAHGMYSRDQWFWQNFITSMCDIKFWKGNENLKTVFQNFERFLTFLTSFSSQKSSLSLLRDENFFSLNRLNVASKNPSFRTDFKNVHMTFVKSAPKKSFSQKTILPIENLPKS